MITQNSINMLMPITGSQPTARIWQVKVCTSCNLRCRYCYEWDRLADKNRLDLSVWEDIFRSIAELRESQFEEGIDRIIWHGGEPTLLPPEYVLQVLALQRDLLGPELDTGEVRNAVQTNLYRWSEALDMLVSANFEFSVSIDVVPGARRTAGGRDAEADSMRNLERLLARGVQAGVILVLARHNIDHLQEAHDRLADIGASWVCVVPAFEPNNAAPVGDLILSEDEAVSALMALEEYRTRRGKPIPISPLDRARIASDRFKRRESAEQTIPRRIIVQPDGRIGFRLGERLDRSQWPGDGSLASAVRQPRSSEWEARVCGPCRFNAACNGRALEDRPDTGRAGSCSIETELINRMSEICAG